MTPKRQTKKRDKIVQAAERACCLCIAGSKPLSFVLILRLLAALFQPESPIAALCSSTQVGFKKFRNEANRGVQETAKDVEGLKI